MRHEPDRYTRRNPNGSFRAPAEHLGDFRILQCAGSIALYGDLVDRLGRYEELLTLEEAEAYARQK